MVEENNKCRKYAELIRLAFDGEADEKNRGVLDEHVKTCAECAREMHLLELTGKLFEDLPTWEIPRGFNEAVLASVRRARAAERAHPTAVWLKWAAGLTAAAAGIYGAVGVETLRSSLWSFVKNGPSFVADAAATVAPLLRLTTSLAGTLWTLFTTALDLAGPIGERLALEQSILIGTLITIVCLYYLLRRITHAPVRLPVI
jgi:hypothetical protein